jgi:hypothetical protein
VNRLIKRPKRRSPMPTPEEQDAFARKMLAAQLIAWRIVQDISYATLMEKIGRMRPPDPGKRGAKRAQRRFEEEAERAGRELDARLAEERFSTIQRYARVVGLRVGAEFGTRQRRPTPVQIGRIVRSRRKAMQRKYGHKPRRRPIT